MDRLGSGRAKGRLFFFEKKTQKTFGQSGFGLSRLRLTSCFGAAYLPPPEDGGVAQR